LPDSAEPASPSSFLVGHQAALLLFVVMGSTRPAVIKAATLRAAAPAASAPGVQPWGLARRGAAGQPGSA